jgi:hypothetical protein
VLLAAALITGCDGGNGAVSEGSASISLAGAESILRSVALAAADIGPAYAADVERTQTNEQSARARPDAEAALRQFEEWRQLLAFNAQYSPPTLTDVLYTPQFARVLHSVTLFDSAFGAASALAYLRSLSADLLADVLTDEGAGTQIIDTQVMKDIAFPPKGDESFAWRVRGTAHFSDQLTINFVADTVFVRSGNINASVTAVALGRAPDRGELVRLVDRFVEKAASR